MKKILIFIAFLPLLCGPARTAVRDGNSVARITTTSRDTVPAVTARATAVAKSRNSTSSQTSRSATPVVSSRGAQTATPATTSRAAANGRGTTTRIVRATTSTSVPSVVTRAAATTVVRAANDGAMTSSLAETQTGAAYEQCKTAFFTCMDQFCSLKNDDYRRCACSDRIYDLSDTLAVLQEAGEQITIFNENLDVVGMTAAQAAAMRTASEGENALTSDKSASKALLQAIMNSIRGDDATVGGKFSDLNSINMSFDTATAFGNMDAATAVAKYNGRDLYSAVYPQCRAAVRADCSDAALQRAITAYLMAVEQDCNTVQTAIENRQKQMKSAVRESSAMLDLARVENRQKHNSADITQCIANVKTAILSEEVCGASYHRCLDNGKFIDIATGAPIVGVVNFYELKDLLKFSDGVDAADQKLSKVSSNRQFVQNFESKTKKFAQPELDKCREHADEAWAEYLDQALLDIYYAQVAKVDEIQRGCFDFISSCYTNNDASITAAMKELLGTSNAVLLQPDKIVLTQQMCTDYTASCNNMFGAGIIEDYVNTRNKEDVKSACRAVAKQCFDQYGGTNYVNFFYPYSGLFTTGSALDWFTLYAYNCKKNDTGTNYTCEKTIKSPCAQQVNNIAACQSEDDKLLEEIFGGLNKYPAEITRDATLNLAVSFKADTDNYEYGIPSNLNSELNPGDGFNLHWVRPLGIASEIYNQIIDILQVNCINQNGRFLDIKTLFENSLYGYQLWTWTETNEEGKWVYNWNTRKLKQECYLNWPEDQNLHSFYGLRGQENICPASYYMDVDTASWGICSCWENGGRRSNNGTATICVPTLPTQTYAINDRLCDLSIDKIAFDPAKHNIYWCQSTLNKKNQVQGIHEKNIVDPDEAELAVPSGT